MRQAHARCIVWVDEKGQHEGVIDAQTGQKTLLTDTYRGPGRGWVHWQDRGFTWIEYSDDKNYRIVWMANETAPRKQVAFPGKYADWGEPGLGNPIKVRDLLLDWQIMVVYTGTGGEPVAYNAWLVDLKTGEKRQVSHEQYRLRAALAPDRTALVLLPDYFWSVSGGNAGAIKIIPRDTTKSIIELRMTPAPIDVAWSPYNTMLAYTQDNGILTIIDKQGKQLSQYKTWMSTLIQWTKTCLPGEPIS